MTDSIDTRQLRALLRTYLRMSMRGRAVQALAGGRSGKPRGLLPLLFIYASIGALTSIGVRRLDVFTYALIAHSMTFLLVGMSLIAEAGDVLFNLAENEVLG